MYQELALILNEEGKAHYSQKNYNEALENFNKLFEIDPHFKLVGYYKGNCYFKLNCLTEALQCYEEELNVHPKCLKVWIQKGLILYNLKRFSEALQCSEEEIKLNPKEKKAWNLKGKCQFKLKQFLEAINSFNEAIKLDPNYKESWENKGCSYEKLGQYKKALNCFNKVVKLKPNSANGWRHKGNIFVKLKNFEEGLKCLDKSLEICDTFKEALNDKGRLFKKKGELDTSILFFEQALKVDPNYEKAKINKLRTSELRNISSNLTFEQILDYLKNNPIDKMDLSDLNIGNVECKQLSEILKYNAFLKELNLENNNIKNKGCKYLCFALIENNTLQALFLKANPINNNKLLMEIRNRIQENQNAIKFNELSIDWNEIILKKDKIKTLVLNKCKLTQLPKEINNLENLLNLDLTENELLEIPNVSNLKNLIRLNLSKNKINLNFRKESTCVQLASLLNLKLPNSIKYLILKQNEISNEISDIISKSEYLPMNILLNRDLLESEIESISEIFFWICFINEIHIPIEKISENIKNLKELNLLNLSSSNLFSIPEESPLSILENLCTKLILRENNFTQIPESIYRLTQLTTLRLKDNNITSISSNISKLSHLKEISIESNGFASFPTSLSQIKSLERIWIDNNKIIDIPLDHNFSFLKRFSICDNKLENFGGILQWINLQFLILNGNKIEVIPKEIKRLKQLKKLHLNNNKLKTISPEIGELEELIELQMKNNLIEEIPATIGKLIKMETIDFSYNQIKHLPASLGLLNKLSLFNVTGNPIINPPIELINNLYYLKGYWMDLLVGGEKCNYIKIIILGEEKAGKTTLLKTLTAYNNSPKVLKKLTVEREFNRTIAPTDGIDISMQALILKTEKFYSLPNDQLILNFWDFGGQEVYHSTHIFFLSPNSVYLIVWNMDKKEEEADRLIYWVNTVRSYFKNAMIILVGTHLDCIDNKPKKLQEIYENISIQSDIPTEFIIGVSCKSGKNYNELINLIKDQVLCKNSSQFVALPSSKNQISKTLVGEIFPKMYFDLKKILEEEGNTRIQKNLSPILELKEFKLIAQRSNFVTEEEVKRGLSFLHSLGFCVYFANDETLSKYVILNSQWLADTMATLITTKSDFIQKGLIDHQHFKQVWREPAYPPSIHSILLELLQKFYVLIPITHDLSGNLYLGKSVVPALLSNETKPINLFDTWNEGKKIEIQRIYEFTSFLPTQIFPQFMATIFSLFGTWDTDYWRDGILIKRKNIRCLIELDSINKIIIISFVGNKFISLFKQIQLRLDMILNKWENISLELYVTCPYCFSTKTSSNRNKCFKLKDCFEKFGYQKYLNCEYALKEHRENQILIKNLIPELDDSQVKKIIDWDDLEIENKIGEGGYAEVYKGNYENNTVAIKKLKTIEEIGNNNSISESSMREFLLEIGFSSYGTHDNLLQFIGIVLSPPSIILPFANYGSLFKLLYVTKIPEIISSLDFMLKVGLDIISGLNYLHSLDPPIIHCDLKSENVLITSINYEDNVVCKLTDFGLSQFSVGKFLINNKVSPIWCAPEVLQKKDQSVYSDIYSFGIIFYEMLTKKLPYSKEENPEWKFISNVQKAVIEGIKPTYSKEAIEKNFDKKISNELYELMESCWNHNPIKRPSCLTIQQILLQHFLLPKK